MEKFNEKLTQNLETLQTFVPVVSRVHGGTHPEFHEVHKLFESIDNKVKRTDLKKLGLNEEFKKLREVTNNYKVPNDVCESYETVYNILAALDRAYYEE